ncbi:hypothetical protein BD414DRAFT_483556 [Trametes punicea]|nr:hypothetical protein BD414DRAFT_483556 [Trametes punicea]
MSPVAIVSLAVVVASICIYVCRRHTSAMADDDSAHHHAYILENTVTHSRLLPRSSTHAFSYPTLAYLLSLNALEAHALDLGQGWLFGYGDTSWRLTGLRSGSYLLPDNHTASGGCDTRKTKRSLKVKLAEVLEMHGFNATRIRAWTAEGDAWMLTMPSYVGYEGINPLTVYFCYSARGELEWVVLEIHNTFGEKHVHVLEPGTHEDFDCPPGFHHAWTFPRDFHVSPFNDRTGSYVVSVSVPLPPGSPHLKASPPRPKVRIHMHGALTNSDENEARPPESALGPLKLTATLSARRATPLTSTALLQALARYPLALFLSSARISYHAWILHYMKRLDVFPRPDPKPAARGWGTPSGADGSEPPEEVARVYGGVGWQSEGTLEAYARKVVERFLARRADELGIVISLMSGDPSVPLKSFFPSGAGVRQDANADLSISYAAPRFFTTLLLAPSAGHMLLLGRAEDLFRVNSEALFLQVFSQTAASSHSYTQMLRTCLLPRRFTRSIPAPADSGPSGRSCIPHTHPLDRDRPLLNALAVGTMHLVDHLEKAIFTILRARFVPGQEPWGRWERAAAAAAAYYAVDQ